MPTPERHLQATELFFQAAELDPARRAGWLDEACAGDPALRRLVEEMLAADESAAGFLERPIAAEPAALDAEEPLPPSVGPFRVRGVLGHGGMGVVYEAEQESPRRRVAVKVLRPGTLGRANAERFRYEAELLGRLQHPGIAQVFAAGTEVLSSPAAGAGAEQPWIAMELVRGLPLVDFVRSRDLGRDDRIELLARVADAVHHAHQRGIVHRDLKSPNVLVDEDGQPKVLDFGVARAEAEELRATLATTPGVIVGTLQTMSPEQGEASPDIDARTDVYSLGVLAYTALGGAPPLDLAGAPLHVALRRLREEEPEPLSAHDPALGGDLEQVVAKALEKDRERRYASAAAFAADLRRVARGEPVEARAPSTAYLLAKLARRHRGVAIGGGLTLATAVAGLVAFALQARATARAERAAASEARASAAIDAYLLQDLLAAPDPRASGRDVRVVEVLGRAADGAEEAFASEPELLARVNATLGKTFLALDERERAETSLRGALAMQRDALGPDDPRTLETECWLVELLTARADVAEGLPLARATTARSAAALGPDHPTSLRNATNLASLLIAARDFEEADSLLLDVIRRRERTLGVDDEATLLARENRANAVAALGRSDEAVRIRSECLAHRQRRYGPLAPGTVTARAYLASVQLQMGRLEDPVATLEEIVAEARQVYGDDHHATTDAQQNLAVALGQARRFDEALELHEQVLARKQAKYGSLHDQTLEAEVALARALVSAGDPHAGADLAASAVERFADSGGDPGLLGMGCLTAGEASIAAGRPEAGCAWLERALDAFEAAGFPAVAPWRTRAEALLRRHAPERLDARAREGAGGR